MLFPINVDVPMTRLPIANWILIGLISLTTFLAWAQTDLLLAMVGVELREAPNAPSLDDLLEMDDTDLREMDDEDLLELVQEAIAAESSQGMPQPVFDPPWWKLPILAISSALAHAHPMHLIGNMLFLWVFGNAVNYKFGHFGFIGLFLLAALIAGIGFYCLVPDKAVIGASGAIMGIVGAYVVFFPRNDVTMGYFLIWTWGTFYLSSWIVILFWFGLDLFFLLASAQTGVAYASHVTGFLTGFVIALLLAWRGVILPTRYEQTLLEVFARD